MRLLTLLPFATLTTAALAATNTTEDACPKVEYACLDVINSSQCIEQLVIEKQVPATKEALVKCVEYEGTATTIPGATKLCRCPGCHSQPINDVIRELFPAPCA